MKILCLLQQILNVGQTSKETKAKYRPDNNLPDTGQQIKILEELNIMIIPYLDNYSEYQVSNRVKLL